MLELASGMVIEVHHGAIQGRFLVYLGPLPSEGIVYNESGIESVVQMLRPEPQKPELPKDDVCRQESTMPEEEVLLLLYLLFFKICDVGVLFNFSVPQFT